MTPYAESLVNYVTSFSEKSFAEAVAFLDEYLKQDWQNSSDSKLQDKDITE